MPSQKDIDEITKQIAGVFPTFGGDRKPNDVNPMTHWLSGKPAVFALGVDVRHVVQTVLTLAERRRKRKAV